MAKNANKLSTMVGKKYEIYLSQVAKMHLNCPPCLEKIMKVVKNEFKLSTMLGENNEIYLWQVAKNSI